MPLAKALKSFRGRYGLIRAGTTFNCEPGYFNPLAKKGWVVEVKGAEPPAPEKRKEPAPDKNRNKPEAPKRAGKERAAKSGVTVTDQRASRRSSAGRGGDGKTLTSQSLRADLPSSAKTALESENGETNQNLHPDENLDG